MRYGHWLRQSFFRFGLHTYDPGTRRHDAGFHFWHPTCRRCLRHYPPSLVSQQMVQLAQAYFQKPNFAPVYGVENNNFFDTRPHTDNMNSWQIRLDQNFSSRDTMFLRLSQMWVNDTQPIQGTISQNPQSYHAYNFGGAWDHVFSPHLILDARAGGMLKPYTFYQNAGLPPVGFKPE